MFIAEGVLVIRRALHAGYRLRSVLVDRRRLAELAPDLAADAAPVYVADQAILAAITGFHVHRGALASFTRRPLPSYADLLKAASRIVILEDVASTTNLGAIIRCAAGLGMDAALLSPECADPLYRRSVRVSMGSAFTLPYTRVSPWPDGLADVRAAGFTLVALTPDPDAIPIDELSPPSRTAVLLGTEGAGLSPAALALADERVRIPMACGVDSLNVAAAAAIACYVVAPKPGRNS